ncbi:MAG: hypothetical protein ACLSVD_13745 [Eggerthellaceae bacterium]
MAEVIADDAEHVGPARTCATARCRRGRRRVREDRLRGVLRFLRALTRIPNHRILAINRGEKEGSSR